MLFNNYRYFIALAEEGGISRAADRLFITHQNLSKYLSNLEDELGVPLFQRKPIFALTYAGQLVLDAFRQVELTEHNLNTQLVDLRKDSGGEIRLGTTEGRLRILMPDIITEFRREFPGVRLLITSAASPELRKLLQNSQLDLIVAGVPPERSVMLNYDVVLRERLYLVISDNMLCDLFADDYPACKQKLQHGADLRLFQSVPFAMNLPNLNSNILITRHFTKLGISPNCVHTSSHPDLHHMMSARDYAASFCLTMYLPSLFKLNASLDNKLNVFPIENLSERNPVAVCTLKNRMLPHYTLSLIQTLRRQCGNYANYDLITEES